MRFGPNKHFLGNKYFSHKYKYLKLVLNYSSSTSTSK